MSDTMSLDGGGSMTGMGGYTTPYRSGPGGGMPMDYPTHTVPRNYHYGPPMGYEDYRGGPPVDTYASLSRGARVDDRYRFVLFSNVSSIPGFINAVFILVSSLSPLDRSIPTATGL